VSTFNAVPDDRLEWKPLDNGRTPLNLFSEVSQMFALAAEVARTRGESKYSYERFKQMAAERSAWDKATALEQGEKNFAALLEAVQQLSQEDLVAPVFMPLRGGRTMALAGWIMLAYRSSISRFAQINYIQTLYGDFEMH
jgi:hypothetical protein